MRKKVLLVEDHEDIRRMMRYMLSGYGYQVVEAADGYEAVETAVREKPDLILMDIAMPILDGLGATEAIRQHAELSDIPIIALSAYGDFYEERARSVGCTEVLQKPVDFDRLEPIVQRYMDQ
ncbi:MAG: response regulator [Pyrinomonadaceae bacterium]